MNGRLQEYLDTYEDKLREIGNNSEETNYKLWQLNEISNSNYEISSKLDELSEISDIARETNTRLDSGFSNISHGFDNLTNDISELSNHISRGFSEVVEQNKIEHFYLNSINDWSGIPDNQKARIHHIQEGFKFLSYATKEKRNSRSYDFALVEFRKAITIEPMCFVSLYRIGYINLRSSANLREAKECFKMAAYLYLAEANVGGTILGRKILPYVSAFRLEATEAYLFASKASYLENNIPEAIELTKLAIDVLPNYFKSYFLLAKYFAASGRTDEAKYELKFAIKNRCRFHIAAVRDPVFVKNESILRMLLDMENEAFINSQKLVNGCRGVIIADSIATRSLMLAEKHLAKHSYVTSVEVENMVTVPRQWKIKNALMGATGELLTLDRETGHAELTLKLSVCDFIKFEYLNCMFAPDAISITKSIKDCEDSLPKMIEKQTSIGAKIDQIAEDLLFPVLGVLTGTGILLFHGWDGVDFTTAAGVVLSFLGIRYLLPQLLGHLDRKSRYIKLGDQIKKTKIKINSLQYDLKILKQRVYEPINRFMPE